MKFRDLKFKKGFTLIELVVVITIFATMSSIILFNSGGFSSDISLQNLADQIALQLKKAQTDAISGTNSSLFAGGSKPSFGVHFDASKKNEFIYFADLNNSGVYDTGICGGQVQGASECLDDITITTGDTITNLAPCNPSVLDISFKRPFPDSIFSIDGSSPTPIQKAGIEITSPKGAKKSIIIWSTGQIEIKSGDLYGTNYQNGGFGGDPSCGV